MTLIDSHTSAIIHTDFITETAPAATPAKTTDLIFKNIASETCSLSKKELTEFLEDIILILQQDLTNGYLTKQECSDYINLLVRASEHIFFHHPNYHEEVQRMTKPLIILPSMQIAELKASLEEKDSILAAKDSEIAELRAKLASLNHSTAENNS